jgi:hypothetical protein
MAEQEQAVQATEQPAPQVIEQQAPPEQEPQAQSADGTPAEQAEPHEEEDEEKLPKWAKKQRRNMERRISSLQRKLGYYEAQITQNPQQLQNRSGSDTNEPEHDDSDRVALSRQELAKLIQEEARKLAPEVKAQEAVIERRRAVVEGLAKDLGREKFDAIAGDLDAALDGLTDAKGNPKPAADAIFEADDPRGVIEYLADPDHADEAAALARMSPIQAGKAIAKLEAKLQAKAQNKPQPSKAPAPIEAARGQGQPALNGYSPHMTDAEFVKWRRQQIQRRA